jgi:hypothetical protein
LSQLKDMKLIVWTKSKIIISIKNMKTEWFLRIIFIATRWIYALTNACSDNML